MQQALRTRRGGQLPEAQGLDVSALTAPVNHRVAIRADHDQVSEPGSFRATPVREGSKVMDVSIAGPEFAIDFGKVEATTWDLADEATRRVKDRSNLGLTQFAFAAAVQDHEGAGSTLEGGEFFVQLVSRGPARRAPHVFKQGR